MKSSPQYVVRAFNVDGRTDLYYGGRHEGVSLWVPISQAARYHTKKKAQLVVRDYKACEVERLTVFGSAPC